MQWGIQARRHILKSIKLQAVDLDAPIIGAMTFCLHRKERERDEVQTLLPVDVISTLRQ